MAAIASVRRKSALLAAISVLLVALGLQAYAMGYPAGMSMLAASTVQAGICACMFASRLLKAMVAANLLLFGFHALVITRFIQQPGSPAVFDIADFACAVFAGASLVFTPVETIALIVRQTYLQRPKSRPPL